MNGTEWFGLAASVGMVACYAMEPRHWAFSFGFAAACAAAAVYAARIGSTPFMVVEAVWAVLAWRRALSGHKEER